MVRIIALLATGLILAGAQSGCSGSRGASGQQQAAPARPPAPAPSQSTAPPPSLPAPKSATASRPVVPSGPWTEWPIAPGAWAYRQDDRGSLALFGEAGRDAIVSLRCDRAQRRLYLSRLQQFAPKPGQASGHMLRLRAHDGMAGWPARPTGGTPAYLAVELAASEPVLDLLATSRGRFALELEGESSLALPAWSEIFRVIEDCRG